MWESRKMLFGENAIRRPQLAANGQQLIVRSLADYTVGACTWQARYDYVSITYTNICACFHASPVMYDGYAIIPNGCPTWAPLLAVSGQHPQSYEPCLMDLLCISPFIRGGPP